MAGYLFEWDAQKASSNRQKHGVASMKRPRRSRPLAMLQSDPAHSVDEQRYIVLGMSNRRRLLVVAFAERPPRTRLISARPATRKEPRQYEEE